MAVLVIDKKKNPLMPCSEKRARLLLNRNRAVVVRVYPFTIRLKDRIGGKTQPVKLKIDPGSKNTGMALVREDKDKNTYILWLGELIHRGHAISKQLKQRSRFRRRRRSQLRFRSPRFKNRTKPKGWLAPSLKHRVDSVMSWVYRLCYYCPIIEINQELVKFDMEKVKKANSNGDGYQHKTLSGMEIREYLLHRYSYQCSYCCGHSGDTVLQVDHVFPKSRGGSNRISNLVISCRRCNQQKSNFTAREWANSISINSTLDKVRKDNAIKVDHNTLSSLRDASAVNSTRWSLLRSLKDTDIPVLTGTGGETKWNRNKLSIPKTHTLDASCIGSIESLTNWNVPVLVIKSFSRGSYKRTRLTKDGFPRGYLTKEKKVHGFQTGDNVKAFVTKGKKEGTYTGRVAIRTSGIFNIQTLTGTVQGINHRYCFLSQRSDGYGYSVKQKIMVDKKENT